MPVETSIVIRTLNESKHLEDLLKGIHAQNYKDWEIVLVDSGSTDGTPDIARRYGARIFNIPSEQFTFGRSLNIGCREARGDYLVFASGHVWPLSNNWLRNMISPFKDPSVAMVYGRQLGTGTSRLSEIRDLDVHYGRTSHILVDEAKGNNGNAAVRRALWLTQPFDESLPGLEDVDWARKTEKKQYRVYYAADATVYHAHEETLPQVYRRHLREAVATKWMFPNYNLAWSDVLRALPYFMLRDVLYAFRHKKRSKIFQIPGTRLAQFLGIYRGVRYQNQLVRHVVRRLEIPKEYQRLVIHGPATHGLQPAEIPRLQPGQVLVQVVYVSVRGTDAELTDPPLGGPRRGDGFYPLVPGHEFAGVVVRTGGNISSLRIGQKVAGKLPVGCGACDDCLLGDNYRCSQQGGAGVNGHGGAYSTYLAAASNHLHKLPSSMPLKHGALVESVAVCLEGLSKLGVQPGQRACVAGCSAMGNICSQILYARGIRVTAVDQDPRRIALLYKYDIDTLTVLDELDQYDYLIEANGSEEALPRLLEGSKTASKILLLGSPYSHTLKAILGPAAGSGRVMCSSVAVHERSWREAIHLIASGAVNLEDHIAMVEPLEGYRNVWANMENGQSFKTLINVAKELEAPSGSQ